MQPNMKYQFDQKRTTKTSPNEATKYEISIRPKAYNKKPNDTTKYEILIRPKAYNKTPPMISLNG